MDFPDPLQGAMLIRRYKRFLADVELEDGSEMTLHCPNTGSMKNCQAPGSRLWYSLSSNPKRKYPGTWQIIEVDGMHLVGINTALANKLVYEAISHGKVDELLNYRTIRSEVPYGEQNSRIDLLLSDAGEGECDDECDRGDSQPDCYVEVKNVSLGVGDALGLFPDAVTTRGQKHLQELIEVSRKGERAVLFFCVQHTGIDRVSPADEIDPEYGRLLREAAKSGVELLAMGVEYDLENSTLSLTRRLDVEL